MKKFISILLSVFMLLTFMPTMAFAGEDYLEDFEIRIGAEYVTESNLSGAGWSYDIASRTLTLSNCTINPTMDEYGDEYTGIFVEGDGGVFNIKLEGNNKVNFANEGTDEILSLNFCKANIIGSGTLSGATAYSSKNYGSTAITIGDASVAFKDSVCIDATSNFGKETSYCLCCYGNDSSVTVQDNATLNLTSGKSNYYSCAMWSNKGAINIKDNAVVNAISGNVTKDGSKTLAIWSRKGINIEGNANVTAISGTSKNMSQAIHCDNGNINILGGKLVAKASKVTGKRSKKNQTCESCAIQTWKKNIVISNATVSAESSSSIDSDAIICGKGSLTITNSDVSTIGGKASGKGSKWQNAGIHCAKKCTIKDSNVYTKSSANKRAYGIFAKSGTTVSGTCNVESLGKIAFNKKPTLSNCTAVVLAGKSVSKAKQIAKPSKNTYVKSKYVNIATTAK